MFCGFGAVVLLVLIINTDTVQARNEAVADLRSEVVHLENRIIVGRENQVEIRNSLQATEQEWVRTEGEAARVQSRLLEIESGLASARMETRASREHINQLKSDLKGLDAQTSALDAEQKAQRELADKVHEFVGEGDRQYLTGLKLGGKRILILLDVSASMLDETIVNVVRLRHREEAVRRKAAKWQRARKTAEWLIANLPADSRFQVHFFNTRSRPATGGNRWISTTDSAAVSSTVDGIRQAVPEDGTSLYHAFQAAKALSPRPDNIILITDGLPTQGKKKPAGTTVSSDQRLKLFYRAIKLLPGSIPVNTILLPMEGDIYAAAAYWQLAVNSQGSFLTPARDWP